MDLDMTIGLLLLIVSLSIITILVYWSKKTIDKIANNTDNRSLNKKQEEISENG